MERPQKQLVLNVEKLNISNNNVSALENILSLRLISCGELTDVCS